MPWALRQTEFAWPRAFRMANGVQQPANLIKPQMPRKGIGGDILVAASACILTISIAGSAVYLGYRAYDRRVQQERVDAFVNSLEHRSAAELATDADQLRSKPRLARYVLPRIMASIRTENDERRQIASMRIAWAFLDNQKVRRTLHEMRTSPRESVAAAAVEALAHIAPPAEAAKALGDCLDVGTGAVVDAVCAGLVSLNEHGREVMNRKLGLFSIDRRVWIAGYIASHPVDDRDKWLNLLAADPDSRVREAVDAARKAPLPAATTQPAGAGLP